MSYITGCSTFVTDLHLNYNVLDAILVLLPNATNGPCISYTLLNVAFRHNFIIICLCNLSKEMSYRPLRVDASHALLGRCCHVNVLYVKGE
jgi:hypothetical protein